MAFSSLIAGKVLTNNCTVPRNHAIDTQTPHYMAGYATGTKDLAHCVPVARRASANYCIGYLPNDIIGSNAWVYDNRPDAAPYRRGLYLRYQVLQARSNARGGKRVDLADKQLGHLT